MADIEVCRYCLATAASHMIAHIGVGGRVYHYYVACKQYIIEIMLERERRKMPVFIPAIEVGDDCAELPTAWELGQARKRRKQQEIAELSGCGEPDMIKDGKIYEFKTVPHRPVDPQTHAYMNFHAFDPCEDFGVDALIEKAVED